MEAKNIVAPIMASMRIVSSPKSLVCPTYTPLGSHGRRQA
jgi:hypothetical protein